MSVIEQLKEEYYKQYQLGTIKSIHVTIKFYYQAVADKDLYDISSTNMEALLDKKYRPFFGFDPIVHLEETEKPFWFEIEPWERKDD